MRTSPGHYRLAFTLTDLLVVIAIIAILAALLLPVLARSKRKAQQAYCIGNLHQQSVALQTFLSEYHCYPTWIISTNNDLSGNVWLLQLEKGGSSMFIVGEICKAPFGGRGATPEISPAQRAGYWWHK